MLRRLCIIHDDKRPRDFQSLGRSGSLVLLRALIGSNGQSCGCHWFFTGHNPISESGQDVLKIQQANSGRGQEDFKSAE